MKRNAFTLIEMLVVVAIVVILAAILFPVFNQAKEQAMRTTYMSDGRQSGLAVAMYLNDWDDRMPMAHSVRADGTHRWSTLHPFPNGSIGNGWETIQGQVAVQWANASLPYIGNTDFYRLEGQLERPIFRDTYTGVVDPLPIGISYNGLLHTYPVNAVEKPELVPSLWGGIGNHAIVGRSIAMPVMRCLGVDNCLFSSSGRASSANQSGNQTQMFAFTGYFPGHSVWTFGGEEEGSTLMIHLDTRAEVKRVGKTMFPNFARGATEDPYAMVGYQGHMMLYWASGTGDCRDLINEPNTENQYVCYFRPDRTH